jgi:hypothetical protein
MSFRSQLRQSSLAVDALRLCAVVGVLLTASSLAAGVAFAQPATTTTTSVALSDVAAGASGEDGYLALTQGLDEYYRGEGASATEWFAGLPEYKGAVLSDTWNSETIEKRDFKKEAKELGRAVAQLYKDLLSNDDDPRYKYWKKAQLTAPTTVYNLDESVYGYLYGLVYKGKLVGYIVVGASAGAPPLLEYSLDASKYLTLAKEGRVFFSKAAGFLVKQGVQLRDAMSDEPVCDDNQVASVVAAGELSDVEQAAVDGEWAKAANMAGPLARESGSTTSATALPGSPVPRDAPNAETATYLGTKVYLQMDTTDIGSQNVCWTTAQTMFVDAVARRIEPAWLFPGHPHSRTINTWIYSHYNGVDLNGDGVFATDDRSLALGQYLNNHTLAGNGMSFSTFYRDPADAYTPSQIFAKHKATIDSGLPTMVGWVYGGDAHAMLGVGYGTSGYYIVRETWAMDGRPLAAYCYTWSGYTYVVYGATYAIGSPTTTWGTVVLRQGSNNYNVTRLEYFLKALYYFEGNPDSVFDAATTAAVKAFQSDNGLAVDGVVGTNTYAKMKVAHIMRFDNRTANWRVLSLGKKGDDVAQLQYRLSAGGWLPGTPDVVIDGVFGSSTRNAVMAFQQYMNTTYGGYGGVPLVVDGMAGVNTMKALVYTDFGG